MTSSDLRSKIDSLWTDFWTGGITNPLTVIEQITYLLFCRMLDDAESLNEKMAQQAATPRKAKYFGPEQQNLRWSHFRHMAGEELLALVRDKVFPFLRTVRALDGETDDSTEKAQIGLAGHLKNVQLLIEKPTLLKSAITTIDELNTASLDTKGDLYEYLLSKLTTAGINGQFRTPRHIIKTMVELMRPQPTDAIGDPACGSAGFLVAVMEYLRREYTTPELVFDGPDGNKVYVGDQLEPYKAHIREGMFRGFDFDSTMLRVSAMNMMLHGVEGQSIFYQDTLSESFVLNYPKEARDHFDLILANPPFKGNLDPDDIAQELSRKVKSGKTELLFLVRILGMLKLGGRCAVIVPDGVLFGSSKAHVALRSLLLDDNQLDAVLSLPSGVFKPYAGVSTAILVFTKGGKSSDVFFFDVKNDGFTLDDKRNPTDANDLPALLNAWATRDPKQLTDRKQQAFFVPAAEIREQKYDLSLNRYKEQDYVPEEYDPPLVILERMEGLEKEIVEEMKELRGLVG